MPTKVNCIHHWVIEPSSGPVSYGVCKFCTLEKYFQNSIYSEKHQITLEKEQDDAQKEIRPSWNNY